MKPSTKPSDTSRLIVIDYTNHRGERDQRVIFPIHIRYTSTLYHREEQWVMDAFCLDRGEMRTFAMKDIHSWSPWTLGSGI